MTFCSLELQKVLTLNIKGFLNSPNFETGLKLVYIYEDIHTGLFEPGVVLREVIDTDLLAK